MAIAIRDLIALSITKPMIKIARFGNTACVILGQ